MASEEEHINSQIQPATPLPPYPEIIMTAIEALDDKNGSNKSAISRQIDDKYGPLPPAHTTLLTHHLNKMKSAGQLIFFKNNYLKPDPNAPPRRGRGRPPKPKAPLTSGIVPPPPRPRGRPPKSHDSDAASPPPKSVSTLSGRKRGRPPKAAVEGVAARIPRPAAVGPPRGRGRPPKVKEAVAAAPVGA